MFEYAKISQQKESSPLHAQVPISNKGWIRESKIMLFVVVLTSFLIFCITLSKSGSLNDGEGDVSSATIEKANIPLFITETPLLKSFCKTSCVSPCSKYSSAYGDLCCDWSFPSSGSKSCALSVSSTGICTCGTQSEMTFVSPVPSPVVFPIPAIVKLEAGTDKSDQTAAAGLPVPAPLPVGGPGKPSPSLGTMRSEDFHPFPTMAWIPFHPFPTMAWLPFKPIQGPGSGGGGGVPCKTQCANPCGWSVTNGNAFCCESTEHGCSMSTSNGQCFCG